MGCSRSGPDSGKSGLQSAELSELLASWEQGRSPKREV